MSSTRSDISGEPTASSGERFGRESTATASERPGRYGSSRYDWVLAAVPLVLLAAGAVGTFGDAPLHAALGSGGLLCALAIADALFVDPPQ